MTRTGRSSVCATASAREALNNSPPAVRGEMSRSDRGGLPRSATVRPPLYVAAALGAAGFRGAIGVRQTDPRWACLPSWPADCCWNRSRRSTIPATRSDSSRIKPALHIVPQRKRECSTISRRSTFRCQSCWYPTTHCPPMLSWSRSAGQPTAAGPDRASNRRARCLADPGRRDAAVWDRRGARGDHGPPLQPLRPRYSLGPVQRRPDRPA